MRRHSHAGVPHVTCGRPPTFDGDAQQEGDDQGSSASSSVVLAYITPYGILYLIITPISTRPVPRGGPGASSFTFTTAARGSPRCAAAHGPWKTNGLTHVGARVAPATCTQKKHMCIPYTMTTHALVHHIKTTVSTHCGWTLSRRKTHRVTRSRNSNIKSKHLKNENKKCWVSASGPGRGLPSLINLA